MGDSALRRPRSNQPKGGRREEEQGREQLHVELSPSCSRRREHRRESCSRRKELHQSLSQHTGTTSPSLPWVVCFLSFFLARQGRGLARTGTHTGSRYLERIFTSTGLARNTGNI